MVFATQSKNCQKILCNLMRNTLYVVYVNKRLSKYNPFLSLMHVRFLFQTSSFQRRDFISVLNRTAFVTPLVNVSLVNTEWSSLLEVMSFQSLSGDLWDKVVLSNISLSSFILPNFLVKSSSSSGDDCITLKAFLSLASQSKTWACFMITADSLYNVTWKSLWETQ